jgi:hypothetical protein
MRLGQHHVNNERRSVPRGPICFEMQLLPEQITSHSQRLVLNANFRLEEFRITLGSLFVGITGGRLQLKFVNGQFAKAANLGEHKRPLRASALPVPASVPSELVAGAVINATAGPNSVTQCAAEDFGARLQCASEVYVSAGGAEQAPYWDFESKLPKALRGDCVNEVLGEFSLADLEQAGEVHAEFIAPPRALWIAGSEEVWPASMGMNQRIVRRLLIWRWLRTRVKTHARIVTAGGQSS